MRHTSSTEFRHALAGELAELRTRDLQRELRRFDSPQCPQLREGRRHLLNFSSNDYLGLANHPKVRDACLQGVRCYGAGSGASRLICGSLAPHHLLEDALAEFKGTSAALTFSSGYATALGTISALLGRNDIIIVDKLVHASIVDAARLSGAQLRVFRHNDLNHLETLLKWSRKQRATAAPTSRTRILVVTESVFSMDGDVAPLREIVELKRRHGAWLMVDEAHATGLYGEHRRGLIDEFSLTPDIEIQLGTLGKALGCCGGYICGDRPLIDLLIHRARSFIFSTASPPANAVAARAAIRIVQSRDGQRLADRLWKRVDETRQGLDRTGLAAPAGHSAILPLILGREESALKAAQKLRLQGIYIPAIRYPTVARNQARLRITLSAAHTAEDVRRLLLALASL